MGNFNATRILIFTTGFMWYLRKLSSSFFCFNLKQKKLIKCFPIYTFSKCFPMNWNISYEFISFVTKFFRKRPMRLLEMVFLDSTFPANIELFKVNNRNTRKMCKICSKLATKKPQWPHWLRSDVFIISK